MRVTGVDACRRGWVAVSLEDGAFAGMEAGQALRDLHIRDGVTAIDMPLGLLAAGWRAADRLAAGLLGTRRSTVFAIPPRAVWEQRSYPAANRLCRELTGRGFSVQAWGLRARLLEADEYRETCGHRLCEVHPELAFAAMAGTPPSLSPVAQSKHTAQGRQRRRELLTRAGIAVPASTADVLDAAAAAWSAQRIAAGTAVTLPRVPQLGDRGREIAIRY